MIKKNPSIEIILVTFRRSTLLKLALESLIISIQCENYFEYTLKVLVNGTDNESLLILNEFKKSFSLQIDIINTKEKYTPAEARNILVNTDKTHSDWLFFIDDDIIIPEDLFANFNKLINKSSHIQVWGGPNITPLTSSNIQKNIGWLLNSWWVVGPMCQRYSFSNKNFIAGSQYNLMLCNLFIDRQVFTKRLFTTFFKTAEENELFMYFKKINIPFGFSNELFVYHERRKNWIQFLKQIFYYGFGRGQLLFFKDPLHQFNIILFIVLINICFVCLFISFKISLLVFLIYFLYSYSQFIINQKNLSVLPVIYGLFIPFIYYFGIVKGVLNEALMKKKERFLIQAINSD